jgi:hypothetical protein
MSWRLRLGVERRVLIAAARSAVQLMLIGLVLKLLFAQTSPSLIASHGAGDAVGGGSGGHAAAETPLSAVPGATASAPFRCFCPRSA